MAVNRNLESIQKIHENSMDYFTKMMTDVDLVHYRQIASGMKAFDRVKSIKISMLEVVKLLEDINSREDGYIINQVFGPKKLAVEDDKLTMIGLILAAKYPEISECITEITMIESVDANFRFVVKVKHYGQTFIWEIIEQISRDEVATTDVNRRMVV